MRVIGHSLGGVIAVDMATANDPLWTESLVTFGSQSPLFHVCDPRGGQLRPYEDGARVALPASLGAWTNLWEPLDVLAFIAAKMFRMHDGSAPVDVPVAHLASSGHVDALGLLGPPAGRHGDQARAQCRECVALYTGPPRTTSDDRSESTRSWLTAAT